jgi:mono/diheme cytochrome c family protein
MKRILLPLALIALAGTACERAGEKGFQPIAYGRDTCAHCRMRIDRPGFGGELRNKKGEVTRYDDVGCLLVSMWALHDEVPEAWVEDHGGGPPVPLLGAHFVEDARDEPTPMGYGIVAFSSETAAKDYISKKGGELVSLEALLKDKARFERKPGGAEAPIAKPGGKRPFTEVEALAGKQVYLRECSACHGERGDGQGLAAPFLDPKPRDFTKKTFKLRTTDSGTPPTTADVLRTITHGLPGSAMPSFAFLTPEEQRKAAAFVLNVADMLDSPEPTPIEDPGTPPPTTPESIAHGKEVYALMQCASCHGPLGKGDGPSAAELKDDDGHRIPVRDFTGGVFRGGADRVDLFYRFSTGMDGSPMPQFKDTLKTPDRWALVDYVMSLRVPPTPKVWPADPIAAGRQLAAKYSCRGCHILDDGKGGDVGPDLRVSAQKLGSDWVRTFLKDPRAPGKIYPFRVYRMPRLALSDEEREVAVKYLAAMGKRKDTPLVLPDLSKVSQAQLDEGKNLYVLRCAQCHALGTIIETPVAAQQGPDLIRVANRVDFDWTKKWIADPKKIDAKSRMTIPTGIGPPQIDSIRDFIWKVSMESQPPQAAGGAPTSAAPQ